MSRYLKYAVTLTGLLIIGAFLVFLYDCVRGLAGFAGRIDPNLEPWAFWILFALSFGTVLWGLGALLIRPRPLLLHADPSEADMADYRRALAKRLRRNPHLRSAGVVVHSEEDLESGLAVLRERANEEIHAASKRVFIGTALSQNGRLDGLVVLFLVTRLVWRLAKLFNQRPHHRELINLYANIAGTTFLAGSIEDFGVDEYIRELMAPLVGGSAVGALPGAQAIAGAITTSILTGSTNCLLTLRCGIVARNYLTLDMQASGAMRRSATLEAARMFVGLSAGTVTHVTKALVKGATGSLKNGTTRVARGVSDAITGTAGTVSDTASDVVRSGRETVKKMTGVFKKKAK